MTQEQYNNSRAALVARLSNALQHRCYLVARARIRDLARLRTDYDNTPYDTAYRTLYEYYMPKHAVKIMYAR